ncbi:hypothetical protein GYB22_01700 [bacterium]|nr:hypothetical protein [bacterium]
MKKIILMFILFAGLGIYDATAQCPMCRTAVESGMDKEHGKGKGLNDGIIYLLATPYLAIGLVGGVWYYRNKKK